MQLRSGTSTMPTGTSSTTGGSNTILTQFVNNPYQANFNPSDKVGAQLYVEATKSFSEDKRIEVTQKNVTKFMDQMKSDARKLFWSPLINLVDTNVAGNAKKQILEDFDSLSLDDVKKQAERIWNNPRAAHDDPLPGTFTISDLNNIATDTTEQEQYYKRNRSVMIADRIEGVISTDSYKDLMLQKEEFTWTSPNDGHPLHDGPTMLKLLVTTVNPTTRVGITSYKNKIQEARMNKHGHNLISMLNDMEANYKKIIELGKTHEDWTMHLFDAMLSAKNKVFTDFIQRKKDDWEIGIDIIPKNLITEAKAKYTNMITLNTWDKEDPKDAKIAALTTQLVELQQCVLATRDLNKTQPEKGKSTDNKNGTIEAWRMKKDGDHKQVNGIDYWWCPHHKWDGKFDGLYMQHKPEDHDEWKKRRDEKRAIYRKGKKDKNTSSDDKENNDKLVLKESMTAALVTNFQISEDQAADIYASVVANSQEN